MRAQHTVRRYLREGGVVAYWQPVRRTAFDGLDDWLRECFFRHYGNADVIRQELESEHGIVIGLRSVELRVRQWRRELKAQKRATVRFETAPGHQMQIDFGDTRVWIGGERVRIHVFVATLGYSRRMHIRASPRQRQTDWFEGMEGAFLRFGVVLQLIRFFLICGTARLARYSLRESPSDGAVICPACWRGHLTAGHDDIRDSDRLITLTRSTAH